MVRRRVLSEQVAGSAREHDLEDQMRPIDEEEEALDRGMAEIVVDCYDEYEEAVAWVVTFGDRVKTPFMAALLGTPVEVTGFDGGPRDLPLCVVRAKGTPRAIGAGDLDEESLPDGNATCFASMTAGAARSRKQRRHSGTPVQDWREKQTARYR